MSMDFSRIVYLALTCAFVHAEITNEQVQDCSKKGECLTSIFEALVDNETKVVHYGRFNSINIEDYCKLTNEAIDCAQKIKGNCYPYTLNYHDKLVYQALYVCSDEGRKETLAIANSDCVKNKTQAKELIEKIADCLSALDTSKITLNGPIEPLCEYEKATVQCVLNAAGSDKCEQDFVNFLAAGEIKYPRTGRVCP